MDTSNTTPLRKEESIHELLQNSWSGLSKHALSFVLLSLVPLVSLVVFGLLAIGLLYGAGFNIELFRNMMKDPEQAIKMVQIGQWTMLWLVGGISILALTIIGTVSHIAMVVIAADQATSVIEAMKKSLRRLMPLLVTGFIVNILLIGSFFMFFVPLFIIGFFLMLVSYEVILNEKTMGGAIKRSVSLTAKNFGYIFLRVLVYLGIVSILMLFVPNVLRKIDNQTGVYITMYSVFINMVIGWYGIVYFVKMYMHIKDQKEEASTAWVYIISFLGWLILFVVGVFGYKVFGKTIQEKMNSGTTAAQTSKTGEQKYLDESQKLFDKMRKLGNEMNEQTRDQSVEQIRALFNQNIKVLKEGTKKYPKSAKIWYQLGNAYTWGSDESMLEAGLAAYKKAEKIEPKNVPYINGVGDMLILMGKNEAAVLQLQKSLRLTKKSGFAYLSLAQAYRNMKLYSEARKNYKLAIDVFTAENSSGAFDARILQAQREMAALP